MSLAAQIELLTNLKNGTHNLVTFTDGEEDGYGLCTLLLQVNRNHERDTTNLDGITWRTMSELMYLWPGANNDPLRKDPSPVPRLGGLPYFESTSAYKFDPSHAQGRARLELTEWLLEKLVAFSKTDLQIQINICVQLLEGTLPLHKLEAGLCALLQNKYFLDSSGELDRMRLFSTASWESNRIRTSQLATMSTKWPYYSGNRATPVVDPDRPADGPAQRARNAHVAYFCTNSMQKFDPETAYGKERLGLVRFVLYKMLEARDKELKKITAP